MIPKLTDRWRATLKARYHVDDTQARSLEDLEQWLATLGAIYRDFIRKDGRGRSIADPGFAHKIVNGAGWQYEQCLAEMLFFDRLRREGFDLAPVGGEGPDFRATKKNVTVWFEVVTPEPDRSGEIELELLDAPGRLAPSAGRNDALRRELLFRITTVLDNKLAKMRHDLGKRIIGPTDACVIVVNDSLLCPSDLPQFGVTHGAERAYDSDRPLIVHATLSKNYCYRYPLPHPTQSLWARADPSDVLRNKNAAPISMAWFHDPGAAHVSAAIQLTLREDYACARQLESLAREHAHTSLGRTMLNELQRGVFVHNPMATNPVPRELMAVDVWAPDC